MDDANAFLDRSDPDDRRAADAYWTDLALPALDGLPPDRRIAAEDDIVARSGIVPAPVGKAVRAALWQPDPDLQVGAAKREKKWLLSMPPIEVDLTIGERRRVEAFAPYAELPLDPARPLDLTYLFIHQPTQLEKYHDLTQSQIRRHAGFRTAQRPAVRRHFQSAKSLSAAARAAAADP